MQKDLLCYFQGGEKKKTNIHNKIKPSVSIHYHTENVLSKEISTNSHKNIYIILYNTICRIGCCHFRVVISLQQQCLYNYSGKYVQS